MAEQRTATAERTSENSVIEEPVKGGEVVLAERQSFDPKRPPVWDSLDEHQRELLRSLSQAPLSDLELAQGVELAAAYQLDPYAGEIWFTKSKSRDGRSGRLLIMVGRDGLRKNVQRNGLELTGSVVRENDVYEVELIEDGPGSLPFHKVKHVTKGLGGGRGKILGAWARCVERKTKVERGWFEADLEEYDPHDTSGFSPWSKQVSVMILAAAERQASRQSTPLGGLLVEGEDEVIDATAVEVEPETILPAAVEAIIQRATAMGYPAMVDRDTLAMTIGGLSEEDVKAWCDKRTQELDELEARNTAAQEAVMAEEALAEEALATQEERKAALEGTDPQPGSAPADDDGGAEDEAEAAREAEAAAAADAAGAEDDPGQGKLI